MRKVLIMLLVLCLTLLSSVAFAAEEREITPAGESPDVY